MNYLIFGGLSDYIPFKEFNKKDKIYIKVNCYILEKYGIDLETIGKNPKKVCIDINTQKIKDTYSIDYNNESIYKVENDILNIEHDKGILYNTGFKTLYTLAFQYIEYEYNKDKYKDYVRIGTHLV